MKDKKAAPIHAVDHGAELLPGLTISIARTELSAADHASPLGTPGENLTQFVIEGVSLFL